MCGCDLHLIEKGPVGITFMNGTEQRQETAEGQCHRGFGSATCIQHIWILFLQHPQLFGSLPVTNPIRRWSGPQVRHPVGRINRSNEFCCSWLQYDYRSLNSNKESMVNDRALNVYPSRLVGKPEGNGRRCGRRCGRRIRRRLITSAR